MSVIFQGAGKAGEGGPGRGQGMVIQGGRQWLVKGEGEIHKSRKASLSACAVGIAFGRKDCSQAAKVRIDCCNLCRQHGLSVLLP